MTAFLIIFIAALFAISIWQISKIVSLGKAPEPDSDAVEVANDGDNKRQGQYMLLFGIGLYALMIACFVGYKDYFYQMPLPSMEGSMMICFYLPRWLLWWFRS